MSDAPENSVLSVLRRLDAKLDRVSTDVQDFEHRMTSVERQLGSCGSISPASTPG